MSSSKPSNACLGCLGNCSNTLKVLNILFHGFLAFLGICIVILSGLALCNEVTYQLITTFNYFINFRQCFGVLLLLGFFLSLTGCFGVISTFQGYHRRLSICLVFYVVLVILSVTILLLTWSDKNINFENKINNSVRKHTENSESANLDSLQKLLGCCGANGPEDYKATNAAYNASTNEAPGSCCDAGAAAMANSAKCNTESMRISASSAYKVGCTTRIKGLIWPIIYGLCIGLDAVMMITNILVILLIFACEGSSCLGGSPGKSKKVYVDGDVEAEKVPLEGGEEEEEEEEEEAGDQEEPANQEEQHHDEEGEPQQDTPAQYQ